MTARLFTLCIECKFRYGWYRGCTCKIGNQANTYAVSCFSLSMDIHRGDLSRYQPYFFIAEALRKGLPYVLLIPR